MKHTNKGITDTKPNDVIEELENYLNSERDVSSSHSCYRSRRMAIQLESTTTLQEAGRLEFDCYMTMTA